MEQNRRNQIDEFDKRIRSRRNLYIPIVIVCGAGKPNVEDEGENDRIHIYNYETRKALVDNLNEKGFFAFMFEDDFELIVPSIEEQNVCRYPEIDKVIVFSHSPAAISEFTSFLEDKIIRSKLVVLVPEEFHPFSNISPGYLDSVFWRILVEGGQVLPYDASGMKKVWNSVGKYLEAYRALKASQINTRFSSK